jgi:hypothetical protein
MVPKAKWAWAVWDSQENGSGWCGLVSKKINEMGQNLRVQPAKRCGFSRTTSSLTPEFPSYLCPPARLLLLAMAATLPSAPRCRSTQLPPSPWIKTQRRPPVAARRRTATMAPPRAAAVDLLIWSYFDLQHRLASPALGSWPRASSYSIAQRRRGRSTTYPAASAQTPHGLNPWVWTGIN